MRSLTARELLEVWEAGLLQSMAQRALLLLALANPELSYEALARQRIGQRDAQLLTLREWLFGSQLISVASCPNCGERLQLTLNVPDLRVASGVHPETLTLTAGEYVIQYRLPDSTDLLALASCDSVEAGRRLMLSRCVQSVQVDAANQTADAVDQSIDGLPDEVSSALAAQMAQADPQADVQFDLNCPVCAHHWLAAFDVMAFLWNEIDRWAQRMLREVHLLASAYGWSEADILSMSASRRQAYLNLIGGA